YWAATGRPAALAHISEALEIAGLGDAVHRRVRTYSQGMRQRLAIAQAMLGLPDLLVLDEPTTGVDAASQLAFAATLAGFVAGGGAVVLVAHELGPLAELVTRSVVLDQGRVVPPGRRHAADPVPDHVHPHAPAEPPGIWQGDHR
ncbi:MAG: ATP-binding cassette domain-containing protein, partial [Natronosporangium sp.]